MKKNFEKEEENNSKNFYLNQQTKTTNVNILLNRVRLDKKKTFRKRLINSIIIISLISLLTAYLIL
tara:strand:+ start:1135 stop:1332 length:198 start_codon:yes stop_codon:yes gene_type:complete